jgi:hypothetical protein
MKKTELHDSQNQLYPTSKTDFNARKANKKPAGQPEPDRRLYTEKANATDATYG